MRFLTTLEKAGRLEFLLVRVVITIMMFGLIYGVLDFRLVDTSMLENPSVSERFSYSQPRFPLFLIGMTIAYFLTIINACRRLKDMRKSYEIAMFILFPVVGWLIELYLLVARGDLGKTYAPFGDNPYDPQSWVDPTVAENAPAVSFHGESLHLPGEFQAPPEPHQGEQAA